MVPHRWQLMALDRLSGKVLWTWLQLLDRVKRHVASHASATPATNGKVIVALFGSEGLFAFDPAGKELWRRDLGLCPWVLLDDPLTNGGQPVRRLVIHGNVVIVQNDRYRDSFLIVRAGNRQGTLAFGTR